MNKCLSIKLLVQGIDSREKEMIVVGNTWNASTKRLAARTNCLLVLCFADICLGLYE